MNIGARSGIILLLFASAAIGQVASAGWSDDPAANLAIADRSGEQTQAKLATREDGKTYVSWFDNSAGGYDVYLQLVDTDGTDLWPHNGVLVADRSFSSTQDYGLAVDTSGNALLAFRDDRGTGVNVTAAAVDASGTLLWGASGVQLANGSDFVAAPKIAGASDGTAVVAWTNNADVILQKLDAAGAPQWGAGVTLSDSDGGSFSTSDLHRSDGGAVIVSMVRQTDFFSAKHLYAQKLSTTGTALWGANALIVFDGGSLQFGNFPAFVSDGSGGAVFSWYDTAAGLQCFVQRVLANGTEQFVHNGVATSTAARDRVSPVAVFDALGSSTFVYWREQLPGPFPQDGVYGQKLNAAGIRQWTDEGIAVAALTTDELTQVRAVEHGGESTVFWVQALAFGNDRVWAARIDDDGNPVWTPAQTSIATSVSDKSRLFAASDPAGFVTLSWSDDRNDANDIYAQNVNDDGSLGLLAMDTDNDGVADDMDNCTLSENPTQLDTNADGYGNACDPDLDNNGVVNFLDAGIFGAAFLGTDLDADFNGDGVVNFIDYAIFPAYFLGPPGPSGIALRTGVGPLNTLE